MRSQQGLADLISMLRFGVRPKEYVELDETEGDLEPRLIEKRTELI